MTPWSYFTVFHWIQFHDHFDIITSIDWLYMCNINKCASKTTGTVHEHCYKVIERCFVPGGVNLETNKEQMILLSNTALILWPTHRELYVKFCCVKIGPIDIAGLHSGLCRCLSFLGVGKWILSLNMSLSNFPTNVFIKLNKRVS